MTDIRSTNGTAVVGRTSYTRDGVGNPTSIQADAGTTTLAYDSRNRLLEVCLQASCPASSDPFIRYMYDSVGNRLTERRPAGTTTYAYDGGDQLTSTTSASGATTSSDYDANGNATGIGSRTYAYDGENRMLSTTSGRTTTSYTNDGEGLRRRASSGTQAAKTTATHGTSRCPCRSSLRRPTARALCCAATSRATSG